MGKLVVRLIILVAIYIAVYVGFRFTGHLVKGTVPSTVTPGTTITKIVSSNKDGNKILEKVFMPCASSEAIVLNLGGKGDKRDAAREEIEALSE